MTRFKEQRRIDNAIQYLNLGELNWAIEYCKTRLNYSSLKSHRSRWEKQVR